MVRKTPLLILSLFVAGLASCKKDHTDPKGKDLVLTPIESQKVAADNAFTLKLFKNVAAGNTGGANLFLSPLSVSFALGMTSNGSNGETLTAINNTMNFAGFTPDQVNSYYNKMITELPQLDPKTTINIANSIWYRQDLSVLPQFLQTNSTSYHAKVQSLNFDSPAAEDAIKNGVSGQTHGKIPGIVDNIPSDVVMYLVNAIYFKSSWNEKFDAAQTAKQPFYQANNTQVQANFMKNTIDFGRYTGNDATVVELPYANNKFSMVIVMPAGGTSVNQLVSTIDSNKWKGWMAGLHSSKSEIRLPKFKFSFNTSVKDPLIALGMGNAFSESADFSRINATMRLHITDVKHKAFVDVNEDGTTAAAATSVVIGVTAVLPPQPIVIDHPFVFAIREVSSGLILFVGTVNDPTAQ
jgi:serpin B